MTLHINNTCGIVNYPLVDEINETMPEGFRRSIKTSLISHLEFHLYKEDKKGNILQDEWIYICDFFYVLHKIRNIYNNDFSLIIEIPVKNSVNKEIILSLTLLAGDGQELRKNLLFEGISVSHEKFARDKLLAYILKMIPEEPIRSAQKSGWYETSYLLPHKTYGKSSEIIRLQSPIKIPQFEIKGTLDDWHEHIGKYCLNNSFLILAVCLPLAAPMLTHMGHENIGIHLWGDSSSGKSTTLKVAASVYGSSLNSWRATDNALENICLMSNDNLLILDELKEAPAKDIAATVYMIGNGKGKARMSSGMKSFPIRTFNLCTLSSGEMSLESKIKENINSNSFYAGQDIRLLSLEAIGEHGHGIFNDLHEFKTGGLLSNHLVSSSSRFRGVLGDLWLDHIANDIDGTQRSLKEGEAVCSEVLTSYYTDQADGQVQRIQQKFSYLAAVGEYAIQKKILPWPEGSCLKAFINIFDSWISKRGGVKSYESINVVERLKSFIERHGASRFELTPSDQEQKVYNRAGFKEVNYEIAEYFFYPRVFQNEIIQQGNKIELLNELFDKGYLKKIDSRFTIRKVIKHEGRLSFYHIIVSENEFEPGISSKNRQILAI